MTVQVVGAAAAFPLNGILADITESLNGMHGFASAASSNPVSEFTSIATYPLSGNVMFSGNVGATLVIHAASQLWLRQLQSGAAVQQAFMSNDFAVPLYQAPIAGSAAALLSRNPFREYTTESPVIVGPVGTTEALVGVACGGPAAMFGTANNAGAVWSSVAGVNGGAWTPKLRTTNGGAVTVGPSSGVPSTAWHRLAIRFTEGILPRIDWMIDDVVKHSISGSIFNINAGALAAYVGGYGFNIGAAGSTLLANASRYRVRILAP